MSLHYPDSYFPRLYWHISDVHYTLASTPQTSIIGCSSIAVTTHLEYFIEVIAQDADSLGKQSEICSACCFFLLPIYSPTVERMPKTGT